MPNDRLRHDPDGVPAKPGPPTPADRDEVVVTQRLTLDRAPELPGIWGGTLVQHRVDLLRSKQ